MWALGWVHMGADFFLGASVMHYCTIMFIILPIIARREEIHNYVLSSVHREGPERKGGGEL